MGSPTSDETECLIADSTVKLKGCLLRCCWRKYFCQVFSFPSKEKFLPLLQKVVAELMGTFILMFLGCGSAFINQRMHITFFGMALTWTAVVVAMGYTLGHVSGCHMNPAVTIGFAAARQFPWNQVPFYIMAQAAGSTVGCLTLSWLFNGEHTDVMLTLPAEASHVSNMQAVTWEIIISCILMLVIRSAGTDPRAATQIGGIAVGAVLFSNIIVAGKITGASMNPVRSLGPAIAASNFNKIWIYMISPVIGTVTGSMLYNFFKIPKLVEERKMLVHDAVPETNC